MGERLGLERPAHPRDATRTLCGRSHCAVMTWQVTAFGFGGAAMLPIVLDELRPAGGEVRQHRLGAGPWVHIRYADTRQQQQALAKNGKVCHRHRAYSRHLRCACAALAPTAPPQVLKLWASVLAWTRSRVRGRWSMG